MNIPQFFSSQETPIEAALDYARKGIPVFPAHVRKCEKQERGIVYPLLVQGIARATTNISEICQYWTGFPQALIGTPTGSITGLLVVHVSNATGVQNWEHLSIKEAFDPNETLSIPTAWGRYYFYQYPMLPGKTLGCTSNIIDGIDVIGEGGCVVLPPLAFWTVSKGPTKILKIGGVRFGNSKINVNEVKITDYDDKKPVKPFPNGLLSYLKNFVIDDNTNVQIQKNCKSSRIGSQILYNVCEEIKKINTRNGCERDLSIEYEQYVEELASYVAGNEINENEAIVALNTAVKASEELIFESNLRHTHEGWIKGFQNPKTSLDYYKEIEEKEKKKTKEEEQIAQEIEYDYENAKLPALPMVY